jgi:hypothetical protein
VRTEAVWNIVRKNVNKFEIEGKTEPLAFESNGTITFNLFSR